MDRDAAAPRRFIRRPAANTISGDADPTASMKVNLTSYSSSIIIEISCNFVRFRL